MKPGIHRAPQAVYREKIKPWMRPYMPGIVNHPVYSTWAMIRAMECAARKLLQPYLEKGEDAVGCEVSVRHLAPAPVGKSIYVTASLKEVRGSRVICWVQAFYGKTKIGEGTHVQYVMNPKRYQAFLKKAK